MDSLNKCEIQTWSEATLIIMMSLFGHHSAGIIFVDPETVARLKQETQEMFYYIYSTKTNIFNLPNIEAFSRAGIHAPLRGPAVEDLQTQVWVTNIEHIEGNSSTKFVR